jgi:hypothetical protein
MRLSPILICVALLCASGQGLAAESRQATDGDGSCPETVSAGNDVTDETDADAAAAPARRTTQKAKPAPAARAGGSSGGGQRSSAPRWHSFLPGMFR